MIRPVLVGETTKQHGWIVFITFYIAKCRLTVKNLQFSLHLR